MAKRGSIYIKGFSSSLYYDDALTVPSETHTFANDIVAQTLEDGSPLTDHLIILQDELEVQIFVSNSKIQESQDTYSSLKTMRNKRELCTVYTDHEIYQNMAIESVSAPHEAPMVNCMTFTVKFKRIDWTGNVTNVYPPSRFDESFENSPNYAMNKIVSGIHEAENGTFELVDSVDMTASDIADSGDITGQGVQ